MRSQLNYKKILNGNVFVKQFFIAFCLFLFVANYRYLVDYPLGLHFIRQTDSISFICYYLNKGNYNFFDLGNLNLTFSNGKASCEFPIIYYIVFIIFKVFGIHLVIIRWLSLSVTIISIYFLLNISYDILKNKYMALFSVLLVISSSVFRYYSVSFLPDSFSLSFTFLGIYHILRFSISNNKSSILLAFLFFTIASLLKVYYGFYLVASSIFLIISYKSEFRKVLLLGSLSLITIVSWYGFSIFYNHQNNSEYYLTHALPIWRMSEQEIIRTVNSINYWYPKYYLPTIFHVLIGFILLVFAPIKFVNYKSSKNYIILLVFSLLGFLTYFLVFFKQFRDHDYYFLPAIPTLFMLTIIAVDKISKISNFFFTSSLVISTLGVISIVGFNYTSLNMHRKFSNSIDDHSIIAYQLNGISSLLIEKNISEKSNFVVIGDKTVNGSLVFLNRFGWTYPNFNRDLGSVENHLYTANYLLILKPSENKIPEVIKQKLVNCKVYNYQSNFIYDLKDYIK